MKVDIGQLISVIGIGMRIAERIKGAKGGKEKEAAVIESVQSETPNIEAVIGLDFVNNDSLNTLLKDYIAARVSLTNGIEAAKRLKPTA